jgi:hypothetical protein
MVNSPWLSNSETSIVNIVPEALYQSRFYTICLSSVCEVGIWCGVPDAVMP